MSSLRAICTCIGTCAPRMHLWKCNIIDAVGRAWADVLNIDSEGQTSHAPSADDMGGSFVLRCSPS